MTTTTFAEPIAWLSSRFGDSLADQPRIGDQARLGDKPRVGKKFSLL
jgi:hypothetical protein